MKRRLISFSLLVILMFSLVLTGCGGKKEGKTTANSTEKANNNFNKEGMPIVNEPITIKMASSKKPYVRPFNELKFFEELEERTNVKIQWDLSPGEGWSEKKNLIFASNDLPDAFYGSWVLSDDEVLRYGLQGMLIPLEDLIKDYAPNVQKMFEDYPEYKKMLTAPDGHIYSLPRLDESSPLTNDVLMINKTWLDKVGKSIPTTIDEFYEVLKAFNEYKDLNGNGIDDEIPFTFRGSHHISGIYSLMGSFGILDNSKKIAVNNDKIEFIAIKPEYKNAVKYFHKLFAEGLADEESFTQDGSVYSAKVSRTTAEEQIVGALTGWGIVQTFGERDENYVVIPPLKGADGHQMWNKRDNTFSKCCFVITSACKNPEIVMRWANEHYEPDIAYQEYYGLFDVAIKKNDEGKIEFIQPPAGKNLSNLRHEQSPGQNGMHFLTKDMVQNIIYSEKDTEKKECDEMYKPYVIDTNYPQIYMTIEENERLATIKTDVVNYVKEMTAKWMMNGGIDEEWDKYIKKLKQMKLDEMIDIYQNAYDRYMSSK